MLKLTANYNYFVGFASVGATSMQENATPVPYLLLPNINWKKRACFQTKSMQLFCYEKNR
jgi:hypothetical protein